MKRCIWFLLDEEVTTFILKAHILPKSLGSKEIFEEECDICNQFFGRRESPRKPSLDIVLKETLILTKVMKMSSLLRYNAKEVLGRRITKNEIQKLDKSTEFFRIEFSEGFLKSIKPKNAFLIHHNRPQYFTKMLKRGLVKVGIEKAIKDNVLPAKFGDFYDEFYNYIRDFVRWNNGHVRLFYLRRKIGAELAYVDQLSTPKVLLHENEYDFLKYEIMGHIFLLSFGKGNFTLHELHKKYLQDDLFGLVEVRSFLDIDIFNRVFAGR